MALSRRQVIGAFTGAAMAAGAAFTPLTAQAGEQQTTPIASLDDWQQTRTLEEARELSGGQLVLYVGNNVFDLDPLLVQPLLSENCKLQVLYGPDAEDGVVHAFINKKGPVDITQDMIDGGVSGNLYRSYIKILGKPHAPNPNGDEGNDLTPTMPE